MVFVKVRETYDLHTVKNKMTVIGIHTPKPDIIKRSYPGLLLQCKAYRPVSADVRIACASVLPLDPKGVGLSEGDVAPEDIFNPILYKAMSNKGMSQLEARINMMIAPAVDVDGDTATVDVDSVTPANDDFNIYYGLLSNTHDWKHANPQAGLSMTKLKPLVYEVLYNVGDQVDGHSNYPGQYAGPSDSGFRAVSNPAAILGNAREFPFINCTSWSYSNAAKEGEPKAVGGYSPAGFVTDPAVANAEIDVPWMRVFCGCIIVPPSRLHELYYRMVVEWTIEFSGIRPLQEIVEWNALGNIGNTTHYQNYSYESTKKAVTGDSDSMLDSDSCMVAANVGVEKVM